jgi:hypothetical protein
LPLQEIPAELLRLYCPGISRTAELLEKTSACFQSKLCPGEQK